METKTSNIFADDLLRKNYSSISTDEFLEFSKNAGNDLSTPRNGFPGLKDGDSWCLCASRWQEAYEAGVAPKVNLLATHILTLEWVDAKALLASGIE